MDVSKLKYQSPCVANERIKSDQISSRIENGLSPIIILRDATEETRTIVRSSIRIFPDFEFSFDLGIIKGSGLNYFPTINLIREFADEFPNVNRTVGVKFGAAREYKAGFNGITPDFTLEDFVRTQSFNLSLAKEINHMTQLSDLSLSFENRPRPNYAFLPEGVEADIPMDLNVRGTIGGSPHAQFIGSLGASSKELEFYLGNLDGSSIDLDIEHLCQSCQYGNIFNIEFSDDGVLHAADLSHDQREALRWCGVSYQDQEKMFDYSSLTDVEHKFLELFGFVFRKGQPLVYQDRLTLTGELERISDTLPISDSITPGFQVYQSVEDTRDGSPVLVQGSHLPGIVPQYIHDPSLRARLNLEARNIHSVSLDFMKHHDIRNVVIEPLIDDGIEFVYEGPEWSDQVHVHKKSLEMNFKLAPAADLNYGPFYL